MGLLSDITERAKSLVSPKRMEWAEAMRVIKQYDGTTGSLSRSERADFVQSDGAERLSTVGSEARVFVDERYNSESVSRWPKEWLKYKDYYYLSQKVDVVRQVFIARKQEIVRKGFEIVPVEGDDHSGLPVVSNKDSVVIEARRQAETLLLQKVILRANDNLMSLKELVMDLEEHGCVVDEQYLAANFDYVIDAEGRIVDRKAKEWFVLHPVSTRLVVDRMQRFGYDDHGEVLMCVVCRNERFRPPSTHCGCGTELVPAFFEHVTGSGAAGGNVKLYAPWEVLHKSFWSPTMTYSSAPPLMSAWMKAYTLLKQDQYIMDYYTRQRPPKVMVVFQTSNADSFEKSYQKAVSERETNPHNPVVLAVQREAGGGATAEVVDLMRPLEEMQWGAQREEYRKSFGALYGVSPILQSDVGGGGLNNEGLQFTVTNRAVELSQAHYNDTFLWWLSRTAGARLMTIRLRPSEELDKKVEHELLTAKLMNAQTALSLGMKVEFDEDTGEFLFSGNPVKPADPFSGVGGSSDGFSEEFSGAPMDSLLLRDKGDRGFRSPQGQR